MIRVPSSLRALVPRRHALMLCGLALVLCSLVPAGPAGRGIAHDGPLSEVVVTLAAPAVAGRSGLAGRTARAAVDADQARFVTALRASIPTAQVRWRYRLVLNGAAVVVPDRRPALAESPPGRQGGRREHGVRERRDRHRSRLVHQGGVAGRPPEPG